MLMISANEARIIKIKSRANWVRRRFDIWSQRRVRRVNMERKY